jgi:SAM-dependent methyltransferase
MQVKEKTMRLAGRIKMGYYPTPLSVVDRIKSFIRVPENQSINAFDPCCGEGLALKHLAEIWNCQTYGIELDEHRAEQAKANLDKVLKCSFSQTRITTGCFSVLFLNPPYDEETFGNGMVTSSERKEKIFLKDTLKYLKPKGLLIYIIPQSRLDKAIAKILSYRFESIHVYKFPGHEYNAFGQIVVFGVKKKSPEIDKDTYETLKKMKNMDLSELSFSDKPIFHLPEPGKVNLFRSTVIDLKELEKEAEASPLWRTFREMARIDQTAHLRPPLPLHQGHIALMLANGCLDGVVGQGNDRHVVKGKVQKIVRTYQEQNEGTIEEREIDQYRVSIRILTTDGEIRTLV